MPNAGHDHGQHGGMGHHHHHHHHHQHHRHHTPAVSRANERKVLLSFFVIFGFMVVEAVGGVLSGSLALLADAGHMLTDAAALALAYAAFRFGRRAADSRRTFGYLRLEVIAGFLNAVTLLAIVLWIAYEAWARLHSPPAILAGPMLLVAGVGLLVNVLVLWIMTRGETDHVNVKGAILHVVGDLLGSIGAILAAVVITFTGWTPIDPILSLLVAALILRSAWRLLSKSVHILLEGAPEGASPEQVAQALREDVSELAAVSHVHVWQLTSGQPMATLHVRPTADDRARSVVRRVEAVLRERFEISHATVAIEWNADLQPTSCSLQPGWGERAQEGESDGDGDGDGDSDGDRDGDGHGDAACPGRERQHEHRHGSGPLRPIARAAPARRGV